MSRLQLALNVSDLDEAVEFYSKLFGAEPNKERPGYANFAIADPPLKLALFENAGAAESLNHLGVEVLDAGEVAAASKRLAEAGLVTRISERETCCHATQHKVYVEAPDVPLGFWELYTVIDENPVGEPSDTGECCGEAEGRAACCAA